MEIPSPKGEGILQFGAGLTASAKSLEIPRKTTFVFSSIVVVPQKTAPPASETLTGMHTRLGAYGREGKRAHARVRARASVFDGTARGKLHLGFRVSQLASAGFGVGVGDLAVTGTALMLLRRVIPCTYAELSAKADFLVFDLQRCQPRKEGTMEKRRNFDHDRYSTGLPGGRVSYAVHYSTEETAVKLRMPGRWKLESMFAGVDKNTVATFVREEE